MTTRIGLTYDLRDDYLAMGWSEEDVAEFDSVGTIDALDSTISSLGYETDRIGTVRHLCARLVRGDRWDLVFNIAEGVGGRGREAQVPSVLEAYGIPYTFSDALVSAATLDKAIAKRLVADAGLATARFALIRAPEEVDAVSLRFPVFVKPNSEGTGKGIDGRSCVRSREQLALACGELLRRYRQPVLVEEFLPGREFTVGILGTDGDARVIGTMEIMVKDIGSDRIYSYQTKEECDSMVLYARLDAGDLKERTEGLALAAYRTLECRDAGRVDIRLDVAGEPCFIEVNPLAGLHPTHSDLPMIATREGMSYTELIDGIVRSALKRTDRDRSERAMPGCDHA